VSRPCGQREDRATLNPDWDLVSGEDAAVRPAPGRELPSHSIDLSGVASQAQPGEVLVSSTVKDLVAGSGIAFGDRGFITLKGVPDQWRLYAVREAPPLRVSAAGRPQFRTMR
jgi:hypothetical protein